MNDKYRVRCGIHRYDTLFNLSKDGAITSARMHAMLPCDKVEVTDKDGKQVEWREKEIQK